MRTEELTAPTFALNENGKVTIFIPEIKGEPSNPSIAYLDENTLFFRRSADEGCRMTFVTDEAMEQLGKSEKCLIIELDLETVTNLYEMDESDLESAFKNVYEADIDEASFKNKGI